MSWDVFESLTMLPVLIRAADLLDVAVVALLAYGVLSWLRQARSRYVLIGLWPLAALYLIARALEMHVTLALFHLGVTVALVALVVIFQEEIRRGFERWATGGRLSWTRRVPPWQEVVDVVVPTMGQLADQKMGALMVFKGREPLARHLAGGDPLDGTLSPPLLHSIFDDSSDGHDGAVIIDDGRITHFGVHLPLSTSGPDADRMGTRHTAALGLSERSDALVVVVSEERGVISVAEGGSLELVTTSELRERLLRFFRHLYPEKRVGWLREVLTRRLGMKALALVIALSAWAIHVGTQSQVTSHTFEVPLTFEEAPEGVFLDRPEPDTARVSLSGPRSAFDQLDADTLRLVLNTEELHRGEQQVALRPSALTRPAELSVDDIDPPFAAVTVHDAVTRELPVEAVTTGRLPEGLRLRSLRPDPARISLVVRRGDRTGQVHTAPIDLSQLSESTTITVSLELPPNAHPTDSTPRNVEVTAEVAGTQQ